MKKIFLLLSLFLLMLTGTSVFGQFTVTKDTLGGDQVLVRIEHQNGRSAEYVVSGQEGEIDVGWINNKITESSPTGFSGDAMVSTIKLPSDEYASSPIQMFDAGNKIYFFGTREVLVVDAVSGAVTGTIPLSNAANLNVAGLLSLMPVNKFITGSIAHNRLYCADVTNRFYVIDMLTDQIVATHSLFTYQQQLSTSVVYNPDAQTVYWMLNTWDGSGNTQINAYNALTGAFITQRTFSQQINDMEYHGQGLFVTIGSDLVKLNPGNLQTLLTQSQINKNYRKLFLINSDLMAVSYEDNGPGFKSVQIFSIDDLTLIQNLGPLNKMTIHDVKSYVQNSTENICMMTFQDGFTDFYFFKKTNGTFLFVDSLKVFTLYGKKMSLDANQSYAYVAGNDIARINLREHTILTGDNLKGCDAWDVLVNESHDTAMVYAACPIEGTYSQHATDCSLKMMNQTAFKTSTGCYNPQNNKAYFVNSRIKYEDSGLAIVDAATDEVIGIVPLGADLIKAMYNEQVNKVFVASKEGREIFVVDGQSNLLVQTISFAGNLQPIEEIFDTGDKLICKAYDKIYLVNPADYSYTTLTLSGAIASYKCKDIVYNSNANEAYLLLSGGYTKIVVVDLTTSDIKQVYEYTIINSVDLAYNNEEDLIYLVNQTLPKFYIIEPAGFTIKEVISYTTEQLFGGVNMEVDYYRNKVWLTCSRSPYDTDNYKVIIDLAGDDYTYGTHDEVLPTLAFNRLNERYYYNLLAENLSGTPQLAIGVAEGLDDAELDYLTTGNYFNRPYTIERLGEKYNPVLHTKKNKIYWPNGDFSNVSVISAYTDRLGLKAGYNWLSFPRLERAYNNPAPAIPLLERINYFPNVYLHLIESSGNELYWNENGWYGTLNEVISSRGYILHLDIIGDAPAPEMKLYGAILDPETPIPLTPNEENWVGYFIRDAQMPLDAIPADVLPYVTRIQAQYWAMIRTNSDPEWRYKGRVMPIQYGDMVIIDVVGECPPLVWNQPEQAAEEMDLLVPEYFAYEEQANYLPLFVEMDAESDIQEIAVLANGEVRGAAVREPGDTLTQVSAYLGGVPEGTPLSFETWSGFKSAPAGPGSYAVFNPVDKKYENRTLYKGENAPYHAVSLKSAAHAVAPDRRVEVSCSPNPSTGETTFTIRMEEMAKVTLMIRDINGRTIANLLDNDMPKGLYHTKWYGAHDNGSDAVNGVYFYSLSIDGRQQTSGKIVLIR
jgi:hypothetical protein